MANFTILLLALKVGLVGFEKLLSIFKAIAPHLTPDGAIYASHRSLAHSYLSAINLTHFPTHFAHIYHFSI